MRAKKKQISLKEDKTRRKLPHFLRLFFKIPYFCIGNKKTLTLLILIDDEERNEYRQYVAFL